VTKFPDAVILRIAKICWIYTGIPV